MAPRGACWRRWRNKINYEADLSQHARGVTWLLFFYSDCAWENRVFLHLKKKKGFSRTDKYQKKNRMQKPKLHNLKQMWFFLHLASLILACKVCAFKWALSKIAIVDVYLVFSCTDYFYGVFAYPVSLIVTHETGFLNLRSQFWSLHCWPFLPAVQNMLWTDSFS